jgi:predicted transcriptional regulator
MDAREGIEFLAASTGRVAVLRTLDEAPRTPSDLQDATGASRSAVHRSLAGFEERGWVHKAGDARYELTAAGQHVVEQYERLARVVDRSDRFSEFLAEFERADDLPFPFDGEVAVGTRTQPQAATEFFVDRLPEAPERLRGLCPVLTPQFVRSFEPVVSAGTDIELVYHEPTVRQAFEAYPEIMELAVNAPNVTTVVTEDPLAAGLTLCDGAVFLGAFGGRGEFRACLHSTDESLRTWGEGWYTEVVSGATPLADQRAELDPA